MKQEYLGLEYPCITRINPNAESVRMVSTAHMKDPDEELPPLFRMMAGEARVLSRESILAKLEHEDIRKDLVSLLGIP